MEVDHSLQMEKVQLQELPGILLEADEHFPKDLLDSEPHPTDQTLVMFADLVYIPKKSSTFRFWDSSQELDADYGTRILMGKLQGWKLLITATNTNLSNGYFGAAFVNTGLQQVVVAHRGTDPKHFGPLFTDIQGIFRTKYTTCMTSAITFVDHIRQAINSANNQRRHYTLAITGHSLGAWLAQITTFSVKYLAISQNRLQEKPEFGIHAKTVGFDSPGARDMLDLVLDNYYDRYAMNVYLDGLNITLYLSAPNHINTCGEHLGRIYRVFNNFTNFNMMDAHTLKYTLRTHLMSNFVEALTADVNGTTNIGEVFDWAKTIEEFDELFKILNKENNYNENAKVDAEFLIEKYHRYKVLELKSPENVDILFKCHFRVFAEEELQMLYKLHGLQEKQSEQNILNEFIKTNLKVEITELFPNFNIDHNNRTIECTPGETLAELKSPKNAEILKTYIKDFSEDKQQMLYKLYEQQEQKSDNTVHKFVKKNLKAEIAKHLPDFDMEHYNQTIKRKSLAVLCNRLKQLMRWLKPEFTQAVDKQMKVFPYAADIIYYAEGQSYLDSLPNCCLDFEDHVDFRGFLDSSTERVLWIVTHSGDGAFQMTRLRNLLHQIQKSVESPDSVKKYFSETNYTFMGWPQMQKLYQIYGWPIGKEYLMVLDNISSSITLNDRTTLINHVPKSMKIILITSQPVGTPNTFELIKNVNSAVHLTDLTLDSQEKIFQRDNVIIFGGKGFSFRQFLGDDCSLDDINQILGSECLKRIATIENYAINLKDTRPTLGDLQMPFFKLKIKTSKEFIFSCVESLNANILVVLSGLSHEQLENEADWEQLKGKEIILAEGDVDFFFKDTCNRNQNKCIYLLEVSGGEVYCIQIFNRDFYLPRKFLNRSQMDLRKFAETKHADDLFVISSEEDKTALLEMIENCKERQAFTENLQIAETKEAEINIIQEYFYKNIHFVKIGQSEKSFELICEWRYSHGSVNNLRLSVSMNSCDELTLSKTERNMVIIADEPGIGKTTSLARLSRHIVSAWVIFIDLKHFQAHVDRISDELTAKNVASFLLSEHRTQADGSRPHGLLQHLLQSETYSKRVVLMFDGYDEIDDYDKDKESAKAKIIRILIFLKTKPTVQIFLTVRNYLKHSLESSLNLMSTCFDEVSVAEQQEFLIKFWQTCQFLELGSIQEEQKGQIILYANELLRETKRVLGPDMDCFIGVPLQLRMLAEVFRPQNHLLTWSPELLLEQFDIVSVPKLYKKFIKQKFDIYFHEKTTIGMVGNTLLEEDIFNHISAIHSELGFRSLFPIFYNNFFLNISEEWLNAMNRHGLIQAKGNEKFEFVHQTYAEYFCAQMVIYWLNQRDGLFRYHLTKEILLSQILLHQDYKIIRLFLNFELNESPMSNRALGINLKYIGQVWLEDSSIFRNKEHQTALHIAVKEHNEHIYTFLLSGLKIESIEEAFISFVTQFDLANKTALNIGDEVVTDSKFISKVKYKDDLSLNRIMGNIVNIIETCAHETKEKIFFASLLFDSPEPYVRKHLEESGVVRIFEREKDFYLQRTLFMEAAVKNNVKLAREILTEGFKNNVERYCLLLSNRNHNINRNISCIHLAAECGHLDIIMLLAEQTYVPFDVLIAQRKYIFAMTPLHSAAKNGHLNIVKYLVERDEGRILHGDRYILSVAAKMGYLPIVKYLVKNGANFQHALTEAALGGHLLIVEYLVTRGADVNSQDNFNKLPLHAAAQEGHLPIVENLVESGANINNVDNFDDSTALHKAANRGQSLIVQYLINKGANIHSTNKNGRTALHEATRGGHLLTVESLVKSGANIKSIDNDDQAAMHIAVTQGDLSIVEFLVKNGIDINDVNNFGILHEASTAGHLPVLEYLISIGADVNSTDNFQMTALHKAAGRGNLQAVEYLLQQEADRDMVDKKGRTALTMAALHGKWKTVRVLLEGGAEINADYGKTLVHAIRIEKWKVVENLLDRGAILRESDVKRNLHKFKRRFRTWKK